MRLWLKTGIPSVTTIKVYQKASHGVENSQESEEMMLEGTLQWKGKGYTKLKGDFEKFGCSNADKEVKSLKTEEIWKSVG